MDLLSCLKNSPESNGLKESEVKHKIESLNIELLKIDSELFELEKKYGEFNVHTSQLRQQEDGSDLNSDKLEEDDQQVIASSDQIPVIEKSSISESNKQEGQVEEEKVEFAAEEEPKLTKRQIQLMIEELERRVKELETEVEQAAE